MSKKNNRENDDKPIDNNDSMTPRKETDAEYESRLKEMTQSDLFIELIKASKSVNANLAVLQKDVVNGYTATQNIIDKNLQSLAAVLKPIFGQPVNPTGQPQGSGNAQGSGNGQGQQAGQQGQQGQQAAQAGQGQGQGQNYFNPGGQGQPMNGLAGIFNNPMLAQAIVAKILGPDPSQNMYAVMGQRFFGESMVSHMLSERARMRKEAVMGVITPAELHKYIGMQERMYGPLIGESFGTEAGIPQQGTPEWEKWKAQYAQPTVAPHEQKFNDGYYRVKDGKIVEKVEIEEAAK